MGTVSYKFHGSLSLELSPDFLEAHLMADKNGDDNWDEAHLQKLFAEKGIREGFHLTDLLKQLSEYQNKPGKEALKLLAAKGTPPQPPLPETWEWVESDIPGELQEIARKVLEQAPPPMVELTRKTPDGPVKEKLLVDPQWKAGGYFEGTNPVAVVIPGSKGIPGKSLDGKTLTPPALKQQGNHLGKGLVHHGESVAAEVSGFLRKGKNWVDLVPYRNHSWDIQLSPDKANGTVLLELGHQLAPALDWKDLKAELLKQGFPQDKLQEQEARLQKELQEALQNPWNSRSLHLTQDQDSWFEIVVPADRLKALVKIQKHGGQGRPLDLELILKAVAEKQFRGFQAAEARQALETFLQSTQSYGEIPVVRGQLPGRQNDKEMLFQVDFITAEELERIREELKKRPRLLQNLPGLNQMTVDEVQKAAEVRVGTVVATIQTPEGARPAEGRDIFGEKVPPYPGNDPVIFLLGGLRRNQENIEATQTGLLESCNKNDQFFLRIREHENALVKVRKSDDNMEAFLSLRLHRGTGLPLSMETIEQTLKEEQIFHGLDRAQIEKAFKMALRQGAVKDVLIARGKAPGTDLRRRLKFLVPLNLVGSPKTVIAPGNPVPPGDFRGGARKDNPIAEYNPPQEESLDGKDVLGNIIPASEADNEGLRLGENLEYREKPGSRILEIYSLKDGEIHFNGHSLYLKDSLKIPSLNSRTGSVKFPGSVTIEGDVESGLFLVGTGEIRIKGQVGASLISSEDVIIIEGGVRGGGKAVLRAKKGLKAGFLEKVVVMSVGDVKILKSVHNSQVMCNARLLQVDPTGSIVGGRIKVKNGMEVQNLGNSQGTTTLISFGQDYLMENLIQEEEKKLDQLKQAVLKIDMIMPQLTRQEDKDKLDLVRKKKVAYLKAIDQRKLKLLNLRDKFEAHYQSQIVIKGTVFPGVAIETHGRLYEVLEKKQNLRIVFDLETGHIVEEKL